MGYTTACTTNITKTCIWRRCGLRVWQLVDVSRSLPQPTLTPRYNEQQRSRSSSCRLVDTSNVLYLTGGILLCLKKVKDKDTDPNSAFYMRQAHSPTSGNKTANIYVKKLSSLQLCELTCKLTLNYPYGRCDQSSKTAKIIWVTLDGAMHMASLQADFSW